MKFSFLKTGFLKSSLFLIAVLCVSFSLQANETFRENSHYKRISATHHVMSGKQEKVEIIEFFLYSCKHCYELEPKLKAWLDKNKDKVKFRRVPAVITPSWVPLAKAYYVAEKLNILEKTHEALFKAIHEDKEVFLNEYTLAKFYEKHGVKIDDFMREYNSEDIVKKVSEARIISVNYELRGVPAIVINDEFKTAPFYNRSQEQMLEVMDYLLAKTTTK